MLCHEYKCIYIHIPKAAGLSVHCFFAGLLGYKMKAHAPLLFKAGHIKAHEFRSSELVSQEVFDSYFKFSFVRNPWARIISEYNFRGHSRSYDFKTFLFKHLPKPSEKDEYLHILPQYDFLFNDDGEQLVDFIGKHERLQVDFDKVCKEIGVAESALPHLNKLPKFRQIPLNFNSAYIALKNSLSLEQKKEFKKNTYSHYTEYYDDESREFVSNLFKKDIDTFGYNFEA